MKSKFPGFYRLSIDERREQVFERLDLTEAAEKAICNEHRLTIDMADQMVENVISTLGIPLGICTNLKINDRDYIVPMAIEEPSVVAAASHACKMLREGGGITAESTRSIMIGQVQLLDLPDLTRARLAIEAAKDELLTLAGEFSPGLLRRGGGPQGLELKELPPLEEDDPLGPMLVVHLLIDVCDAMGANVVNTICEGVAPMLAELSGGRVRLRILSNLTDRRLVTVKGRIPFEAFCKKGQPLSFGQDTAHGIEEASVFAERDPYRAATHNKGIMNGIDAVLVATGQDYRAVEAGAHAYAARNGRYTALSKWRVRKDGLHGTMTLPLAVGIVGGITRVHPTVKASIELLRLKDARDLAQVAAAVGLAQNVAALRALAMEGIQQGHMKMHARNLAAEIGAVGPQISLIAQQMADLGTVTREAASSLLKKLNTP